MMFTGTVQRDSLGTYRTRHKQNHEKGENTKLCKVLIIWLPFPTKEMFKVAVDSTDVQFFISNVKIK